METSARSKTISHIAWHRLKFKSNFFVGCCTAAACKITLAHDDKMFRSAILDRILRTQ